jgi:O-antigen/teichoic acid export membrane protein
VALPFVTRTLSPAEFGVFATLTGLGSLMSFADLGIGGALTTRLAETLGRNDRESARAAVSTAVVASCLTGAFVSAALAASLLILPWQDLLGAHDVRVGQVNAAVLATAASAGLAVPAGIGQRMLYGVNRGGLANTWLLFGSIASGCLMILGSVRDWPVYAFVLAALGTPVLVGFACVITVIAKQASFLKPLVGLSSAHEWRLMRGPSGWYFVIAVSAGIGFQADTLIVSSILGAPAAGVFALAVRMFGLISASLTPALLQLWPAFGEAYAQGDRDWIRSRLSWSTAIGVAASAIAGLVVIAAGRPVIGTLFTDALVPDSLLLIALACWTTCSLFTAPSYLLLNATGRVRVHGLVAIAVTAVNLPLSLILTHLVGISGPAWGSLIATLAVTLVPGYVSIRKVLARPVPLTP